MNEILSPKHIFVNLNIYLRTGAMCLYLHLARARAKRKYDVAPASTGNSHSCCSMKETLSSKAVLFFIGRLQDTTGFDGYKTGKP